MQPRSVAQMCPHLFANALLLPESCILKFPLISLIVQKRKISNFLLWKLARGAHFNQNTLCRGASWPPLIDVPFPEHPGLSWEGRSPALLSQKAFLALLWPFVFLHGLYLFNQEFYIA